jgi:hypothetical protein
MASTCTSRVFQSLAAGDEFGPREATHRLGATQPREHQHAEVLGVKRQVAGGGGEDHTDERGA